MTTDELRKKAVEAADKAQSLPRFIISVDDKSWLKAGTMALMSVEGTAFLQKVISVHGLEQVIAQTIKHSE